MVSTMTLADVEKQTLLDQDSSKNDINTQSNGKIDGNSTIGM
jgi:hypothetical protein